MALPTRPPATAPITAPPTGFKPEFLAINPPVMPPATAPIPAPACWREPGAPHPASEAACSDDERQGQNLGSRCRHGHTPHAMAETHWKMPRRLRRASSAACRYCGVASVSGRAAPLVRTASPRSTFFTKQT